VRRIYELVVHFGSQENVKLKQCDAPGIVLDVTLLLCDIQARLHLWYS
jgi:hypothetical protein